MDNGLLESFLVICVLHRFESFLHVYVHFVSRFDVCTQEASYETKGTADYTDRAREQPSVTSLASSTLHCWKSG